MYQHSTAMDALRRFRRIWEDYGLHQDMHEKQMQALLNVEARMLGPCWKAAKLLEDGDPG